MLVAFRENALSWYSKNTVNSPRLGMTCPETGELIVCSHVVSA
jgi:hypothetical protein